MTRFRSAIRNFWRAIYQGIAPRAGFPGQAFHLGFRLYTLAQLTGGWLPIIIFLLRAPAQLRVYGFIYVAFKVSIGSVVTSFIVTRYFPVLLHPSGVRARTLFGVAYFLKWEEIHAAAPIKWLFFTRYVRLTNAQTPLAIWIPLFLPKQAEFERKVRQFAPPDNPLRRYFES